MNTINQKKQIVLKLLLFTILLIVLLINKNRSNNFNEYRFTSIGDSLGNATITEMFISDNKLKIQTTATFGSSVCQIKDKYNNEIKGICTLPISSDIAYVIFQDEVPSDFIIEVSKHDLAKTSNYSNISNIKEYIIREDSQQYTFDKRYIVANNSSKLLNTFPSKEELNSMLEMEYKDFLVENKDYFNSNIQMLEIEISTLELSNTKLNEKVLELDENQAIELEKSLSEIRKNKDRLEILYREYDRYNDIKPKENE